MNNRFKFRVWLPSLNKFGSDNSVFMDCYGKLYGVTRPSLVDDSRSIVNIGQFKEFSGHTIQWYTGLTDKNGKEIYEGDIIHLKFGELNANLVVKWDKYMGLKYHNGGWTSLVHVDTHGEVIGNIFENPELPN
jgi:uncharacterized phage protein (TIGR01671 family)